MIILKTVFILTPLLSLIFILYRFIQENIKYRKYMKNLNEWSKFHEQLMNWSKEIVDVQVRVNFINQCAHKLIKTSNDKLSNDNLLDNWSVEEEKEKVCKEWGQHIPSLLQEMRDRKLKQIL